MFDILYQGTTPPSSFSGLSIVQANVSRDTLETMFSSGRALNSNYSIIIKCGGVITYFSPTATAPQKVKGLSLEEFRKLFTDSELEALDSYDMAGCPVVLTDAQKVKIRAFITKAQSRGGERLIDVTTAGSAAALDYLIARGFIASARKAEIIAGTVKS